MKTRFLLVVTIIISNYFYAQNTFTEHLINQPLSSPVQIQSADIDGDGDKDFAAVSENGELTWHEQISSTTFKTHYISMDINGYSLALSDLDDDTNMDIIVTYSNNGIGTVSWFENDGNQNFTETVLANSNVSSGSNKTIVIDIDNDGDKDVISSTAGEIRILRNDGNENLINESTIISLGNASLSEDSNDIEIIDFDNDGLLDFLVVTRNSDGINWYKQNINHSFTDNSLQAGAFTNIAVGNLDGDTDLDIIAIKDSNTSGTGNEIIAYYNNGDNLNFTSVSLNSINPALNSGLKHINLSDIDNDNDLDLIYFTGDSNDKGLKIITNSSGVFSNTSIDVFNSAFFTDEIGSSNFVEFIIEDINLDTKLDIVQVNANIGRINYYQNIDINAASNNFSLIEVSNSAGDVDGVSVADLNNDNNLDIIASSKDEHTLEWFNNSGDNINFATNRIDFLPRLNHSKNKIVDLDGDGFLDILGVNEIAQFGGFYWYKNNNGSSFTINNLQSINNGGETPVNINYADFDNDGDIDIINTSNLKIQLLTNDGSENFTTTEIYNRGLCCLYTSEIYDVDNDNLLDIVLLGNGDVLGYLKNNGGNSFSAFNKFLDINDNDLTFGAILDFEFNDIDNDGDFDIIGINGGGLFSAINNGSNKFETNILTGQGQFGAGRDLKINDIDNDGDKDIIVGGDFGVYWAKNENQIFTRELIVEDITRNRNCFGVELADMDNDGDADVIYSSYTGNKVAWLENKIDETLSTNSLITSQKNIVVYPNPTSGILEINLSEEIKNINLYNLQGQFILKEKTNVINLSHLPKGIYFIRVLSKKGNVYTKKIIRN